MLVAITLRIFLADLIVLHAKKHPTSITLDFYVSVVRFLNVERFQLRESYFKYILDILYWCAIYLVINLHFAKKPYKKLVQNIDDIVATNIFCRL
jgi:hypothetical protein